MSEETSERLTMTRYEKTPAQKQTVAQMVEWCEEHGLDPAQVRICGGFNFMWTELETEAEMDARMKRTRAAEERHIQWLRQQVLEQFGVVLPESQPTKLGWVSS